MTKTFSSFFTALVFILLLSGGNTFAATTVNNQGNINTQEVKEEYRAFLQQLKQLNKSSYSRLNKFQDNIARGLPNEWRCRAGARYLYISEDGLVHYCSQQRGYPGKPLAEYTLDDIRREFLTEKSCAPYCTISCSHQTAYMDWWRAPQRPAPQPQAHPAPQPQPAELVQIESGN